MRTGSGYSCKFSIICIESFFPFHFVVPPIKSLLVKVSLPSARVDELVCEFL